MEFKIKKKIKPNLLKELSELKNHRTNFNDFSVTYLLNVSKRYNLMHHILNDKELRKNKHSIYIAAGQYISSLVTCWETYFRDIFVYVVDQDPNKKNKINDFIIEKGISTQELEKAQLSLSDYGSKQYNFQDLNDTCNALNFLLNDSKNRITDFIEGSLVDVVFAEPNYLLYWLQEERDISQELYTVLEQGFEYRHKLIHDANFIYEIEPHFISAFEDCMVIFPQLISILFAKKYKAMRPVYNVKKHFSRLTDNPKEGEVNFIFSRKDFEGNYQIVD
ncbi:hypothetical protein [Bacillus sp. ISL-39]|uniref:hypothetical protein n=1 Tax=Bacillus sp. ISL-39 TaxID=2819124 RepID=UPI001BEB4179|nr:hypothetical protein [Bacillus sp. ISL-39]MBT2636577.1 hypothetical protein [Bacillus sp. ISL-39]